MSTEGVLRVKLTGEQSDFNSSMKDASGTLGRLGITVKETGDHAKGFNSHLLTSRHSVSLLAATTGQAVGPLHHLAIAFEMLPLPIAAAAAGMLLWRESAKAEAEETKKAAQANRDFRESMDDINRAQAGKKLTAAGEQMRTLNARMSKNQEDLEDLGGDTIDTWLSGQLKAHPFLKHFANKDDIKRGKLLEQQKEIKAAQDQLYAVPLEKREVGGVHAEIIAAHLKEMKLTNQGIFEEMKKANGPGNPDSNLE